MTFAEKEKQNPFDEFIGFWLFPSDLLRWALVVVVVVVDANVVVDVVDTDAAVAADVVVFDATVVGFAAAVDVVIDAVVVVADAAVVGVG